MVGDTQSPLLRHAKWLQSYNVHYYDFRSRSNSIMYTFTTCKVGNKCKVQFVNMQSGWKRTYTTFPTSKVVVVAQCTLSRHAKWVITCKVQFVNMQSGWRRNYTTFPTSKVVVVAQCTLSRHAKWVTTCKVQFVIMQSGCIIDAKTPLFRLPKS